MDPVRFTAEDGIALEGELRLPERAPVATATICHAHPRHGGSKDHPLLWAIRNELAHRGFVVLSFNFRGVMGSSGISGGRAEVAEVFDARAAIQRVREEAARPTLLAGWSFGGSVALRTAQREEDVGALVLVGIPLVPGDIDVPTLPGDSALHALGRPTLLLAGENDEFCPQDDLRSLGDRIPGSEVVVVDGADHYFSRREKEAAGLVGEFAARTLPA